jgi:hypothetical protein
MPHPSKAGFVAWEKTPGHPSDTAKLLFAKWCDSGGWLETSVKLPGPNGPSRKLRWHLPVPAEGDAYDDAARYGGGWFEWVVERMKAECPGFLLCKASVERSGRVLEYDSSSRHVFCMLRAFAEYWSGRVPPGLGKGWIDALPDVVEVAPDDGTETEEEEDDEAEDEEENEEENEEEEQDDGVPPPPSTVDPVLEEFVDELVEEVAQHAAREERASAVSPPARNPTHVAIGCGQHRLRVPVLNLCRGTLIIGDPGSGKTQLAKHVFERFVGQVPTLTSHVVFDWKGDFRQLAYAAQHAPAGDATFADVEFVTYTFNRDASDGVSTPVTLNPFFYVDELVGIDRTTKRGRFRFAQTVSRIALDVLSGTIRVDSDMNTCLDTCPDLPVMSTRRGQHGVNKKDDRTIASALHSSLMAVLTKVLEAGAALPRTYADLFREVRCAFQPCTADGTPAEPIVEGLVKQEDMDALAVDVQTRMAAYDPRSNLYVSGDVPLNAHTLFDRSARTKPVKVSIVALGYSFGDDVLMEVHKRTVMATVLSRILTGASAYGTDDSHPHAVLYLDEASCYLGKKSPLVDTVTSLMRVHRDKGVALVLSTQRPNDLSPAVRSMVGGLRLVGKFVAEEKEKVALLSNIVKDKKARKPVRDAVDSLGAHEFLGMTTETGCDVVRVRAPSRLKRVHESSAQWNGEET